MGELCIQSGVLAFHLRPAPIVFLAVLGAACTPAEPEPKSPAPQDGRHEVDAQKTSVGPGITMPGITETETELIAEARVSSIRNVALARAAAANRARALLQKAMASRGKCVSYLSGTEVIEYGTDARDGSVYARVRLARNRLEAPHQRGGESSASGENACDESVEHEAQ